VVKKKREPTQLIPVNISFENGKRWKSHFRGPKIKNFPGDHAPGTP